MKTVAILTSWLGLAPRWDARFWIAVTEELGLNDDMTVQQLRDIPLIMVQGAIDKVLAGTSAFTPTKASSDIFVTDDGYRLYRHSDGSWYDVPPDSDKEVDLGFDADAEGYPVDHLAERLDGRFET